MRSLHSLRACALVSVFGFTGALGACGGEPVGGGAVVLYEGADITGAVSWTGTYEVQRGFAVRGTLTLAPCTRVRMQSGVVLSVRDGGSIRALGSAECPVRIESAKAAPAPGDWGRIEIYASASNDSVLRHTQLAHGDGSQYGVVWVEGGASLGLDNVRFSQSRGASVVFETGARSTQFASVGFENTDGELARVPPAVLADMTPVTVSATTNARVVLNGADSTSAMTWRNLGVPIEVPSMAITGGAVDVEAGTVLRLSPLAVIAVRDRGALRAMGTAERPVTFESAKAAPAPGDWTRIEFYASSEASNRLRNTTVRHGGDATYGTLWVEAGARLALEAATLTDNSSCDVGGEGAVTDSGSTFVRCAP